MYTMDKPRASACTSKRECFYSCRNNRPSKQSHIRTMSCRVISSSRETSVSVGKDDTMHAATFWSIGLVRERWIGDDSMDLLGVLGMPWFQSIDPVLRGWWLDDLFPYILWFKHSRFLIHSFRELLYSREGRNPFFICSRHGTHALPRRRSHARTQESC